jgi:hypothetical protein
MSYSLLFSKAQPGFGNRVETLNLNRFLKLSALPAVRSKESCPQATEIRKVEPEGTGYKRTIVQSGNSGLRCAILEANNSETLDRSFCCFTSGRLLQNVTERFEQRGKDRRILCTGESYRCANACCGFEG